MKYECHLNIAYGDSKREKLDIYGEHLRKDSPILIFVWFKVLNESKVIKKNFRRYMVDIGWMVRKKTQH